MLTSNKYYDYIIWCILRIFIYQYLFIFSLTNLSDLPKSTLEFIENTEEFCKISQIDYPSFLPTYVIDAMPLYKKINLVLFIFAVLGTLGVKIFQFISGVCVIAQACLFNHPLKQSKLKPGESFQTYNLKYPWIDTVLTGMFGLFMVINSLITVPEWILKSDEGKQERMVYLEEDYELIKQREKEKKEKEKKEKKNN